MARSKAPKKKKQGDFKKIHRKLGRKLPPPKNATNTEIRCKAITLREQSVGADKSGFATSNKGLTLMELLNQTGHANPKVRSSALDGIEELLKNHPSELQSKKDDIIKTLQRRINDSKEQVRINVFNLFKNRIFPACQEGNKGNVASLLMKTIHLAMVDTSFDVRLMACKFLHLVVEYHPPIFSLSAEKVLEDYKDIIIGINCVQYESILMALSGLTHCLSLLPCEENHTESHEKENETLLAYEQDDGKNSARFANVSGSLMEIVGVLTNRFQDFIRLIHDPQESAAQSLLIECLLHIICSIRYAIKFYIRRSKEGITLTKLDQDIASTLSKKLLASFPLKRDDERYFNLNGVLTEIFLEVSEWSSHLPLDLSHRFLEFIENTLLGKTTEKTLLALLPFLPTLTSKVDRDWRDKLMQAFTLTFSDCKPESRLKLACVSIVRDMIIPNGDILYTNDPTVSNYQLAWVNKLPPLLNQLGDKHPLSTKVVMRLLLDLGRVGCLKNVCSTTFEQEIGNFFNTDGAFKSLPKEVQELALSFLFYFTIDNSLSSTVMRAIVSCCLCQQLEPDVLYRIVEVLHSSYRDGFIEITDHFSFLVTLIARFRVVVPEESVDERRETTFKALTKLVCSCLSGMGDSSLILQILENVFIQQIVLKPDLYNGCGILRMICTLDSKPTRLSESSVTALSEFLPGYLIDIVNCIPEDKDKSLYYLVPCFLLFDQSAKLTEEVLRRMRLMVSEATVTMMKSVQQDRERSRNSLDLIRGLVSAVLQMHNDAKLRKIIAPFKSEIDLILSDVVALQVGEHLTVEGKHMLKIAGERLRIASNSLLCCH